MPSRSVVALICTSALRTRQFGKLIPDKLISANPEHSQDCQESGR